MNKRMFRISLIVSILLHAVLAAIVWIQPAFLISDYARPERVEVDLVDADQLLKQLEEMQKPKDAKTQGQIVSQSDKSINNQTPEDAKYLSKNNQKVEQQTRAELMGQFRNTTGSSGQPSPQTKPGESDKPTEEKTLAKSDEKTKQETATETGEKKAEQSEQLQAENLLTDTHGVKGPLSLRNLKPSFRPKPKPLGSQARGGGDGPSATDDHLKDVKTGMQTLLSTREFVYYSYYNRIKDRLRQYWEPKIKEKMERIMRQGRTIASDQERITKVVIILDRKGTLVRVQIVGASGVRDLDEAAIEAFRAAAPFPNPPKGIVEEDGLIRIRWDFILEASTDSPLRFQNVAAL